MWRLSIENISIVVGIAIFFRDSDYYRFSNEQIIKCDFLLYDAAVHVAFDAEGGDHCGNKGFTGLGCNFEGGCFIAHREGIGFVYGEFAAVEFGLAKVDGLVSAVNDKVDLCSAQRVVVKVALFDEPA